MLSFRKITLAALFLISACGFSPLYTNDTSAELIGQVSLQEPKTQNDFIFYSHLIDRFGESSGEYTLHYAISTSKKDTGLNFDGTAHRVEIFGSVVFSLTETKSGVELLSNKEEINMSYSNFGSTAAVLNAERTTYKQLVVLLADKVADKITLLIIEKGS